ncbi:4-(cytidine 5'-diphospho)-2-C-methyl-D-erythritol kinase [bacterium]|nr:4-(cytidine 5'-diphospho)-2-C-methyl-D-erythritol kinase [bacterium]
MTIFKSPAKINVGLFVYPKRNDGYHPLDTIFFGINLFDHLQIEKSSKFLLTCSEDNIPIDDQNIISKVWRLFSSHCKIKTSLKIHLEKKLPSEAGIGGASGNAALVLWILNELHGKVFDFSTLSKIALQIGADVPFFLQNTPCFAKGIGEEFTPIHQQQEIHLVLIKPRFSIKTSHAFSYLDNVLRDSKEIDHQTITDILKKQQYHQLNEHLSNDFELIPGPSLFEIQYIKDKLKNFQAQYTSLSGSGSCIYGIFSNEVEATAVSKLLSLEYQTYLCKTLADHSPQKLNVKAIESLKSS